MIIRLIIADEDTDYSEHLSKVLSDKHSDMFEISTCSSAERFADMCGRYRFDIALLDHEIASKVSFDRVVLPVVLVTAGSVLPDSLASVYKIKKYQRISSIASDITAEYAKVADERSSFLSEKTVITVSWSPAGGTGKTSVALAFASERAAEGKEVMYLNLEKFSSTGAFFSESDKGISSVLRQLDSNAELVLKSLRRKDSETGIYYLSKPDNYEDISILGEGDVEKLINASASGIDELVVDISSSFDQITKYLLNRADRIFIVGDRSAMSEVKMKQFAEQNSMKDELYHKVTSVSNKGAKRIDGVGADNIALPMVNTAEPRQICTVLAAHFINR